MSSDAVPQLRQLLRGRLLSAAELTRLLAVSQPTLSRLLRAAQPEVAQVKRPGQRTPLYGLLRGDLGIAPRQSLHRVDAEGRAAQIGEVLFLDTGGTCVRCEDAAFRALNGLYEGLPPFLRSMMPSGFVGRELARRVHPLLQLPPSLRDWRDEHHLVFLVKQGHDTPGDLILGAEAAHAVMLTPDVQSLVTEAERGAWYRDSVLGQAQQAGGASAGGEQPKFLVSLADGRHLLVKYAATGSRWADLLVCEHLALQVLQAHGVPAAQAHWFEHDGLCHLEVARFDRQGAHGRLPFVSAGAVDDELFGHRDHWAAFGRRCAQAGLMSPADAALIEAQAAFGVLIGNNDMHFENLGLVPDYARGSYRPAPAYDVLPMRYAPVAGAVDPPLRPIPLALAESGVSPACWATVKPWAVAFWERVAEDERIGAPFRALAVENRDTVRTRLR
jgi:hypothetical protein